MLRSRSLDLSFIRRGRKRSAIRSVSQALLRDSPSSSNCVQPPTMAVSSADIAPSKRSRGLADIDPKFVSNSGLSGLSEVGTARGGSVRIQHRPPKNPHLTSSSSPPSSAAAAAAGTSNQTGSRFPKLEECAHFHYDVVDLGPLAIQLYDEGSKSASGDDSFSDHRPSLVSLQITSYGKSWIVRRSYEHFRLLDEQLHRCIYDRKFSQLPALPDEKSLQQQQQQQQQQEQELYAAADRPEVALRPLLTEYVSRLSAIAGNLINCAPVLNWLEVDNRGRRLFPPPPSDDADAEINTPAVAAAYAIRRYAAIASDEISFEVGDMISVIDMPPPEESIWWRGKRGFDVGFFPSECVRVIGDKVPAHLPLPSTPPSTSLHPHRSHSSSASPQKSTCSEELPSKPVLRKHGKLISFFRSFILSRPSRRKLKQSGILKERVFGCDLGEHLLNSGRDIPMVLKCCAEFIEEYGIVDGIYRLSGVTSNIQKLRNAFDEDRVPALVEDEAIRQDIHAVSSLLKMYFRELPNPLCTYQLYDQFVNAVQGPEDLRVLRMREVVQQLPPPHYRTLEYLTRHLARVAQHNASTGMTAKNVAIVWAPNLLRCKELEFGGVAALQGVGVQAVVTECLVRYVDLIFSDKLPTVTPLSGGGSLSGSGALKRTRPKSLAISTPTKLLSLEEARNRALQLATQNDTHYIEVGGGPASLPPKYHTVIELPSDRKRGNSLKHKKSPLGWKSLFAKGRGSPSAKAQRKGSSASTGSTASMPIPSSSVPGHQSHRGAVTYIRPRLRPVKSAESLVSSNRNSLAAENASQNSSFDAVQSDVDASTPQEAAAASTTVAAAAALKQDYDPDQEDDNCSSQDGQVSRCHNRSVSHDSYFRLLVNARPSASSGTEQRLDEEDDNLDDMNDDEQSSLLNEVIYAEISKTGTKKDATPSADQRHVECGSEFGKHFNLTAADDPNSSSSKASLNNLSHLDDSELNMMSSREMLAVSGRQKSTDSSPRNVRQASSDESAVDDSTRGGPQWEDDSRNPLNAEQIDEVGNWAASNPAYELFCVQAEVHHQRNDRSPSPDNTEAQVPDISSEAANDEDSDSLVNVGTEGSLAEATASDRESYTLHAAVFNDTYENVMVHDSSRAADLERRVKKTPSAEAVNTYENFADNCAYAVVQVAPVAATYENVIDPSILDEYEPIETPAVGSNSTSAAVDDRVCYENIDNVLDVCYENVGKPMVEAPVEEAAVEEEGSALYENVDIRNPDNVNVYEDVVPPPPSAAQPEEVVYHQVKFLRQSIQEVNQLLKEDPSQPETPLSPPSSTLHTPPTPSTSSTPLTSSTPSTPSTPPINVAALVKSSPSATSLNRSPAEQSKANRKSKDLEVPSVKEAANPATREVKEPCSTQSSSQSSTPSQSPKKLSLSKPPINAIKDCKPLLTMKSITLRDACPRPPGSKAMETEKRSSMKEEASPFKANGQDKTTEEATKKDSRSVSLPSLVNSGKLSVSGPSPKINSLPPTPMFDLPMESESESSKRRLESEIGRDLLRERRTRKEIQSSRHSESNLSCATSTTASIAGSKTGSDRMRSSNSESSSLIKLSGNSKPALPQKIGLGPRKSLDSKVDAVGTNFSKVSPQQRPTTLETSFDYEPPPRRVSSPPSATSPLSPKSTSTSSGSGGSGSSSSESPKKSVTATGRFGSERQPSVKELLNKFQTTDERSLRVAPTSPAKSISPVPKALPEDVRKVKEGKENIEVNLVSIAPTNENDSIGLDGEDHVESSKSIQDPDAQDSDCKELSRQKAAAQLVVGVDMSDPRTRLRIERYKEERRSFLREKYKSESFRSDTKEDAIINRLKQKASSPTRSEEAEEDQNPDSPDPKVSPPALQMPEPGLIDEEVNVKERAAQWAHSNVTSKPVSPSKNNSNGSVSKTDKSAQSLQSPPKRIRDMAAMFEKESP